MSGYIADLHSCTSVEDHDELLLVDGSDLLDMTFEYYAQDTDTFEQQLADLESEEKAFSESSAQLNPHISASTPPILATSVDTSAFVIDKPLPPWHKNYVNPLPSNGSGVLETSDSRPVKRNKSKHELGLQRKSRTAIQIAIVMLTLFNSGDVENLQLHIARHFHEDCKLKTPAVDDYLTGQHFIFDFLEGLLLAHADVVMFGKNFRYHNQEISFITYFAGSKDRSTEKDYLFKKQTRSRVDEMKTDSLSPAEVERLREIERSGKVISVQGKGCFVLKMEGDLVRCMDCTWTITSMDALQFQEA
ncbi:hypothetical protein EON65_41055 [archaeon]|nr:MAG: hypothetical protein EON65_41055 [archaeon]